MSARRVAPFHIAAALTVAVSAAVAQEVPPVLTLADAVALALQNNTRIQEAAAGVEEARLAQSAAGAAFRPQFVPHVLGALGADSLSNQSYGLNVLQRFRSGTELHASTSTASARNQLGTFYYSETTVAVTQPLFNGGTNMFSANERAAQRASQAALESRESVERQVAVDVAAAYYAIVAQQRVVIVAEHSLRRARHLLAASEAKLGIGKVSQLDVLRARQLARQAEGQLLDARAAAEDAEDQLRLLTGHLSGRFVVEPRIPDVFEHREAPYATGDVLARRQDIARARAAIAEAERAAQLARRPFLPRVDLKLALTRRETADSFRSSFGFDGFRVVPFVGLSAPMERTGPEAGREVARLEVERRRRELRVLESRVEVEVRRAVRQQQRSLRALDDARAAVEFATSQMEVARVRFERGLSNNLELVSAETDLLVAESRRITAAAAAAVARLHLKMTLGTLDPRNDFTS